MKKAEWQAVYAPRGDALERRVRTTLDGLTGRPERAYPRRAVFVAAALVLALIAAAAVAAGLTRSARYDAKRLAYQALEEKYGFTTDMESFFTCTAEEKTADRRQYRANKDVGDFCGWRLPLRFGTVRLASWSNDGEAVGDDFSSDVCCSCARHAAQSRRKSRAR
ncbi:MAG: hypothetical protein ACLUMK_00795 [Christensenellales bacterium]